MSKKLIRVLKIPPCVMSSAFDSLITSLNKEVQCERQLNIAPEIDAALIEFLIPAKTSASFPIALHITVLMGPNDAFKLEAAQLPAEAIAAAASAIPLSGNPIVSKYVPREAMSNVTATPLTKHSILSLMQQ